MRRAVRWSPVLRVAEWWVGGGLGVSSQRGAQRPQHLVRPSWRWSTPSVPTPDGQSYLQRYKTVFGKTVATVRHTLNRFQPFSADHRFTLVSWGVLGGVWWILAGSTTFVSLLIWLVPSDEFQLWVAAQVSKHVTRYAGAEVTFGSAIQPTWKTLRFNDVRVVRTCEMTGVPNAMELDVTIQQLDVRISLLWLLEGKGLVEEAVVHGVRGVLNRRTSWDQLRCGRGVWVGDAFSCRTGTTSAGNPFRGRNSEWCRPRSGGAASGTGARSIWPSVW